MNTNLQVLPGQPDIHPSPVDSQQPQSESDSSLVVQVRGFAKSYGRNQAVKEVNIKIHR
jgi:hypothetical protein